MQHDTNPHCNLDMSALKEALHSSSSINAFPPEIISQIMILAIPPFSSNSFKQRSSNSPATTPSNALCLVCRLWYNIGLSTPQLWNNLTIDLDPNLYYSSAPFVRPLGIADRLLSRAGTLSLSIRILGQYNDYINDDGWLPFVRWLTKYFTRLRDLDLRVPNPCLRALAASQPNFDLPIISTLHIKCSGDLQERTHLSLDITNINDTLVDVSLTRLFLSFVCLPYRSLIHLSLRCFFNDEILMVLSQTPNLEHLVIQTVLTGNSGYALPSDVILLGRLETLNIISDIGSAWYGQRLLGILKVPKLRTLRIFADHCLVPLTSIEKLLQNSDAYLETMIIASATYKEDHLFLLWSTQPSLTLVVLDVDINTHRKGHCRLAELDVLDTYRPGKGFWQQVGYVLPALSEH